MSYFLSTTTIENAYKELSKNKIDNASILHIFFILKACNFNKISYEPVSVISEMGLVPARNISSLFLPNEELPPKYDFISPFSMQKWEKQAPSEPLNKWVRSRIKNNVIGGATTWRKIVDDDPVNSEVKFKYSYIDELIELTIKKNKINLFALSIWANRFSSFPKKITLIEISKLFNNQFNISTDEEHSLFTKNSTSLNITYSDEMHDASIIRNLIGIPDNASTTWLSSKKTSSYSQEMQRTDEILMTDYQDSSTSYETICELLEKNHQLILSGPPGTSKSYLANKIGNDKFKKENITRIQFHPKYSYQDFIGGYIVRGTVVEYIQGVLYKLSNNAKEHEDRDFLLIIDEINRANVGQVFGETIQCLDRNSSTQVLIDGELQEFSLPTNLKIIGTMNTSDRSIGAIDFAIKRRFTSIYCPSDPDILVDLCTNDFDFSFADFLRTINRKLFVTLKNKELAVGHTFFLDINVLREGKFNWNIRDFELMFNFKILPLIEDFTKGNTVQLIEIIGAELHGRLSGSDFNSALVSYLNNES